MDAQRPAESPETGNADAQSAPFKWMRVQKPCARGGGRIKAFEMLDTTAAASRTMLPLVSHIRNGGSHRAPIQHSLFKIFDLCHNSNPDFRERQNASHNMGVADLIWSQLRARGPVPHRGIMFRTLGQMCFNNEPISAYMGPRLMPIVLEVISCEQVDAVTKREAIYCVQNAAANSWEVHDHLVQLAPVVVDILRESRRTQKELCAQCVFYLGVLAYNPDSRTSLVAAGATDALVSVVASKEHALYPTSAAVALACLDQGSQDECRLRAENTAVDVIDQVVRAFGAALESQPFPEGSEIYFTDWKLMLGVHQLARASSNKQALLDAGICPLLHKAAASENPRLAGEALRALWHLSTDDHCDHHGQRHKRRRQ